MPTEDQDQTFGRLAQALFAAESFKQRAEKAERERDEWRHLATSLACLITVEWSNVASDLCDQINDKDNANRVLDAKEQP